MKENMKTLKDLKKDLNLDEKLKKQFINLKSKKEAISLAQNMGYDISLEELEKDEEINEDLLESVAGGRGKVNVESTDVKISDASTGKKSVIKSEIDVNDELDKFKKLEEKYRR